MPKYKLAFIGRSNVGKSSLINYLLGQNLAKTSKHPGKTRKHDLYSYNTKFDFVDMPGYGYAAVDGKKREIWDKIMLELFFEDSLFQHLFVLIDSSISPVKIDKDFLSWLVEHKIFFSVIFTKIDKAKAKEFSSNIAEWTKYINLLFNVHGAPKTFQVSALNKKGGAEIKAFIQQFKVVED
jgi:GTP-binding protein